MSSELCFLSNGWLEVGENKIQLFFSFISKGEITTILVKKLQYRTSVLVTENCTQLIQISNDSGLWKLQFTLLVLRRQRSSTPNWKFVYLQYNENNAGGKTRSLHFDFPFGNPFPRHNNERRNGRRPWLVWIFLHRWNQRSTKLDLPTPAYHSVQYCLIGKYTDTQSSNNAGCFDKETYSLISVHLPQ